jgi:predicted secreted protein
MALAGKSVTVEVSTDDAAYNAVDEINSVSMNHGGNNYDVSEFGASYVSRIQGLKDCSWSLSGFYDPADTNGQVVIRTAFTAGSDLYVRMYPDGSAGFKQQVAVSGFNISGSVDGPVELSIELEGMAAVATAP